MADSLVVNGLDDAMAALQQLPRKLRIGALRKGLRAGAKVIRDQARQNAPVLQKPTPQRIQGLVKRSIVIKSSRIARKRGDVGVFVTVARSKEARNRGAFSNISTRKTYRPNDPYYYRFLEMGTKKMTARSFLGPALQSESKSAVEAFSSELRKALVIEDRRR